MFCLIFLSSEKLSRVMVLIPPPPPLSHTHTIVSGPDAEDEHWSCLGRLAWLVS